MGRDSRAASQLLRGVGLPAIRGQQSDAERGDGCFDAGIAEDEGIWASMLRNN